MRTPNLQRLAFVTAALLGSACGASPEDPDASDAADASDVTDATNDSDTGNRDAADADADVDIAHDVETEPDPDTEQDVVDADSDTGDVPDADADSGGPAGVTAVEWTATEFVDLTPQLSTVTVTTSGALIAVTAASSPMLGLEVEVPPGAIPVGETLTFQIEYAELTAMEGLPEGARTQRYLVRIRVDGSPAWNEMRMFERPVQVTIPFDWTADHIGYYSLLSDGTLESTGVAKIDRGSGHFVYHTRTFGNAALAPSVDDRGELGAELEPVPSSDPSQTLVGIIVRREHMSALRVGSRQIDSGFRPSRDGWRSAHVSGVHPAWRGVDRWAMVAYADLHFTDGDGPLVDAFHDDAAAEPWLEERVAAELIGRFYGGLAPVWDDVVALRLGVQTGAYNVVHSAIGGLLVTGRPQTMHLARAVRVPDPVGARFVTAGEHAVLLYRVDGDPDGYTLHVYDPNYAAASGDGRRLTYVMDDGFANYTSNDGVNREYNGFSHVGLGLGLSRAALLALKRGAEAGFESAPLSGAFTIDAVVGLTAGEDVLARAGTTDGGRPMFTTSDTAIAIEGRVSDDLRSRWPGRVDRVVAVVDGHIMRAPLDSDGTFRLVVPLRRGLNPIALVATEGDRAFAAWAGYEVLSVLSETPSAALTVTLTWADDSADLDLYVREPNSESRSGDTVSVRKPRVASATTPYLDVVELSGVSLERYRANVGATSLLNNGTRSPDGLYGAYLAKAHYRVGHRDDDFDRPVRWRMSWRTLMSCPAPCADLETNGFWFRGSAAGLLTEADAASGGSIENAGPEWSDRAEIDYAELDPTVFVVPPSTDVMFP